MDFLRFPIPQDGFFNDTFSKCYGCSTRGIQFVSVIGFFPRTLCNWGVFHEFCQVFVSAKNKLTPMEKLDAYKKAVSFSLQSVSAFIFWSSQPVVPQTTGTPSSSALLILSMAASGH